MKQTVNLAATISTSHQPVKFYIDLVVLKRRPESGRAAEQLSHPYLHSNMAAHRLCMVYAVWGHVLPQIMGRHSTQNTPSENLKYTWTIVIINAPGYL